MNKVTVDRELRELSDWHNKTSRLWPLGMEQSSFHIDASLTIANALRELTQLRAALAAQPASAFQLVTEICHHLAQEQVGSKFEFERKDARIRGVLAKFRNDNEFVDYGKDSADSIIHGIHKPPAQPKSKG